MSQGYSGTTSFHFEVERYRDKDSGQLITSDQFMEDNGLEYEYLLINLMIEGQSYYSPGRTYGPPEDCYPPESDTEIISVVDEDGKDWEDNLTDSEREFILQEIEDRVTDP